MTLADLGAKIQRGAGIAAAQVILAQKGAA
jgi:hypothetical protein